MKQNLLKMQIFLLEALKLSPQWALQKTQKFVTKHYKNALIFFGLLAALVIFQEASFAGTDGDDFADIYTKLESWSKGTLGKVIALGMFLVGLATGVVQQSIIAVVIGISGALSLYYGPAIINSVVSAVI
jgi:conjugal transfer pilus assembly protein TraA